ncbi:unnamed protein product [Orchesella dallaii]|uniref:Uncharacterized protein n=1 Tax=Orchesella dallaii TaxID=48710 RepID=A0ABP1PV77_9HEXA
MFPQIIVLLLLFSSLGKSNTFCGLPFEGFGVFLGSVGHFQRSPQGTIPKVVDLVYNDLGIRLYRTSYEPEFSTQPDQYEITCKNDKICYWDEIHKEIAKYSNFSIFASIWIAPYHLMIMEDYELPVANETQYLYYIKNVTNIIQEQYGLTIERISPINEPENVFATWDHTNMSPEQLCRMIRDFNDPLISLCPENSYVWVSDWYKDFMVNSTDCNLLCPIHITHAYAPNLNPSSPDFPLAYYDLTEYSRETTKPIWMTEVSSTWNHADQNQMKEALDLSTNIVNMVASTCMQRYYFWYAYTKSYSGESLIWGDDNGNLQLPKKYHAYKHFTYASTNLSAPLHVRRCDEWATVKGVMCASFGDKNAVFVNKPVGSQPFIEMKGFKCSLLCCTTNTQDWRCDERMNQLPEASVCSCYNIVPDLGADGGTSGAAPKRILSELIAFSILYLMLFMSFNGI